MSAGAAEWVWEYSRAQNGSLILLLAIAREIDRQGNCIMTVAELADKARLSERAVQNAVRDCEQTGYLSVTPRAEGRRSGYALRMARGADSAPLPASKGADIAPTQNLHPAESAPHPRVKPQVKPMGAESAPREISDAFKGSVVSGNRSKSRAVSETPRPDVDRLCAHLADRIEANGSKRPVIGKRWKDSARLLIDKDDVTEEQAHAAIDWCQEHHFWHRQILSMDKLREKYDRLRLDAIAEQKNQARPSRQQNDNLGVVQRFMERAVRMEDRN